MSSTRRGAFLAAVFLLTALACDRGGPPEDCTTLDCREQAVLEAWARDPEAGAALVLAVEDPVEQLALVERIAHAMPGRLGPLCRRLPQGSAARQRCAQTDSRPHLGRRDPGLAASRPPPQDLELTLPTPPAPAGVVAPETCAQAPSRDSCLRRRAEKAAQTGATGDAIALCHADGASLQADECVFRVAERLLQQPPSRVPLDQAQDLCLQAGGLAQNCLGHVVLAASQVAPPADRTTAEDWAPALAARDRLLARWPGTEGAAVRAELEDLFWAEATRHAVDRAQQLTGGAAAVLPAAARPHLRCALAAAVLAEALAETELDVLVARLGAVERGGPQPRAAPGQPLRRPPLPAPDAAEVPAGTPPPVRRHMMGLARRWSVEDPAVDGAICLVEAAVRVEPPRTALLAAAQEGGVPVVQATAERLAAATGPAGAPPHAPGAPPPPR